MNPAFGRSWTEAEDEDIRANYAREGAKVLAARLDRTKNAVNKRAERLGVQACRAWTAEEDQRLALQWGLVSTRAIAHRLNRTPSAVYLRASEKGIVAREIEGKEDLNAAAKRVGFTRFQLRRILEADGVLATAASRSTAKYKLRAKYVLDPIDVDEAVARHLAREGVWVAAKRRGVSGDLLVRALKRIGVERPAELPKRYAWRLDDETIDRALAARRAA